MFNSYSQHKSFCFVFTSSIKNNIENENIGKNIFHSIFLNFEYWRTCYTVQIFSERDLKIQKLINGGILITAGVGWGFVGFIFQKKITGGPRLFGALEYDCKSSILIFHSRKVGFPQYK